MKLSARRQTGEGVTAESCLWSRSARARARSVPFHFQALQLHFDICTSRVVVLVRFVGYESKPIPIPTLC
jgi:hypothetical protein